MKKKFKIILIISLFTLLAIYYTDKNYDYIYLIKKH